jgi:Outer membrane protein beta-barrel domain
MRKLFFLLLIATLAFAAGSAQAQNKIEVFGGYSFLRGETSWVEAPFCNVIVCEAPVVLVGSNPNLNGWELSGFYKVDDLLGLGADFGGSYGSFKGASYHVQTYLFGPHVSFPGRVSPFANVLLGVAHSSSGSNLSSNPVITPQNGSSNTSFAASVGVGIDLKVTSFVWVRPIQIDYLATHFNSNTQSLPRLSAGVVLHF